MSITTYPLNGIEYYARDAAGYSATRTSGVYSTNDDFPVTPAGGRSVTVGAGQGWVRPSRFEGYSIVMRESQTVTLPAADSKRSRIDRIVLRYDAAARQTTLTVLQGTPDSQPTAPALTRSAVYYDLCLAEITRPANAASITAAHIRDTRANESLCGLMRDGVTRIPTEQLEAEARAQLDSLKESYTGGFVSRQNLTLDAGSWTNSSSGTYPWVCDASCAGCNATLTPVATIAPESAAAASAAEIAPTCETQASKVRFRAKKKPTASIAASVMLFGQSTGSSSGTGTGLTDTEKSLVLSLLAHTIYDDALMQSIYDQLHALWDVEIVEPTKPIVPVQSITLDKTTLSLRVGNTATLTATISPSNATDKTVTWSVSPAGYATVDNGKVTTVKVGSCTVTATAGNVSATCTVSVIAEPNSTSVPGETPVYKLAAAKTFVAANQEYIDTGIKMFESIDPKPDWTILFEVQGGANANAGQALLHCMEETEPWPGFTAHIVNGGYFQMNMYGSSMGISNLEKLKNEKNRYAIQFSGSKMTRWNPNTSKDEKTISGYDTAVDKTLLIGCYQEPDGTKGRFFDGTLYQCMVFHKALTDEQIATWLTT